MFPLTTREFIFALLNGFLIGIANLIPGVSGGTFALVLGLYDRLINATTTIDATTIQNTLGFLKSPHKRDARVAFAEELRRIDFYFLISIFLGIAVAILSGAKLIQYLLAYHPSPTLALFIGLIIPSLSVPWKMLEVRNSKTLSWMIPGIIIAVIPVLMKMNPEGSDNPIVGLATGAIAISAMILPGVSGSYIMLVLGEYQVVLAKIANVFHWDSILFLGAFAFGCLLGLLLFTRLIRYLLDHKKSSTMAFLIGLILGSFVILWPFKNYDKSEKVVSRSGEVKRDIQIATATNQFPTQDDNILIVVAALVAGLGLGFGLNYLEKLKGPDYKEIHPNQASKPTKKS